MEVKENNGALAKIGDRFEDKTTGKIYVVIMVLNDNSVILEGENGLGRRITDQKDLKQNCEKLEDRKA
jgi:hypothetical protein